MKVSLSRLARIFLSLCAVLLFLAGWNYASDFPQPRFGLIEATKVDWLRQEAWTSPRVSVGGFKLGISREEAMKIAKQDRKKLVGLLAGRDQVPCLSERCSVETLKSRYTGIELEFDTSDKIAGISIDAIPLDANPDVQRTGIAKRFVGETKHFFDHYSDAYRKKIFGEPESTKSDRNPPGSPIQRLHYLYPRVGLEVSISLDDRHPDSPFDLTVKLVPPR